MRLSPIMYLDDEGDYESRSGGWHACGYNVRRLWDTTAPRLVLAISGEPGDDVAVRVLLEGPLERYGRAADLIVRAEGHVSLVMDDLAVALHSEAVNGVAYVEAWEEWETIEEEDS